MSDDKVSFERTRSGKLAKFNFYKLPLIWVEGDDDVVFFQKLLKDNCHLEAANGRLECEFLAKELSQNNWPYGVIVDGDYSFFQETAEPHQRVVVLIRYAVENYLLEYSTISAVCRDYVPAQAELKKAQALFDSTINDLTQSLKSLVALDVANQEIGTGEKCFPDHADEFISNKLKINQARIAVYQSRATAALNGRDCSARITQLEASIEATGIRKVLRGHFVAGLVKHLISNMLKEAGVSCHIDKRGLLMILSAAVWQHPPTNEHVELAKRLIQLISDIAAALAAHKTPIQLPLDGDFPYKRVH